MVKEMHFQQGYETHLLECELFLTMRYLISQMWNGQFLKEQKNILDTF